MFFKSHLRNKLALFKACIGLIILFYLIQIDWAKLPVLSATLDSDDLLLVQTLIFLILVPNEYLIQTLKLQLALIYFLTGFSKLMHVDWISGDAIELSLVNAAYSRFIWNDLLEYQAVRNFLKGATYLVLIFEVGFPVWVYFRHSRKLALTFGLMFHLATLSLLDLRGFPFIMMSYYLLWLPDGISGESEDRQRRFCK